MCRQIIRRQLFMERGNNVIGLSLIEKLTDFFSKKSNDDIQDKIDEQDDGTDEYGYSGFYSRYISIRQSFQPYWHPKPKELIDYENQLKNKGKQSELEEEASWDKKGPKIKILRGNKPLDRVFNMKERPEVNTIWYYRDKTRHQVLGHFTAEGRNNFDKSLRSDEKRKQLKPLLYPKDEQFDRTHLFPFGYIGTENDNRLVVGWRSEQNRTDIAEFENRISSMKTDVYWFTAITRTKVGAKWNAYVFSVETGKLLDSIELQIGYPSQPVAFYWEVED